MARMTSMPVNPGMRPTSSVQTPHTPVPKTSTFFRDRRSEAKPQNGALTVEVTVRSVSISPIWP